MPEKVQIKSKTPFFKGVLLKIIPTIGVAEGFRTLNQGQTVEYEEAQGPKGLFAAKVLKVQQ